MGKTEQNAQDEQNPDYNPINRRYPQKWAKGKRITFVDLRAVQLPAGLSLDDIAPQLDALARAGYLYPHGRVRLRPWSAIAQDELHAVKIHLDTILRGSLTDEEARALLPVLANRLQKAAFLDLHVKTDDGRIYEVDLS